MAEFAHELQVIRGAQAEEIEAQRQDFEMKLCMMGERLELYEAKASSLTDEINALKRKGARFDQDFPAAKKKPVAKKVQITSDTPITQQKTPENLAEDTEENVYPIASPEENTTPAPHFILAKNTQIQNYALVAASKPAQTQVLTIWSSICTSY